MKDMFCASQAATAICLSMEELGSSSSASSSTIQLGGGSISGSRAIDRYNPIIRDSRRTGPKSASAPCSAHSPISPKPQNKNRKSTSKETKRKGGSRKPLIPKVDEKRKSSVEANENINNGVMKTRSWSCRNPGEFITPPGSSRYLLSEKNVLDALSDFDPVLKLSNPSSVEDVKIETDESCPPKPPPSSNQVVVLRVSLHCRGCERKMRKHISRMQGVKSFNIDFAAKKVTVTGDVTPLGVLASISKVKNAQLWTPTLASSVPSAKVSLNNSELKNNDKQLALSHEKIENVSPSTTIQLM
ncbi:protein SODIUM POTASSIUM ROOT DEFECTIVE 2 isoform X2 [Lycium ferocissimum]|uniref:protein SODIUM POTASSIUM ROOT DEFECTIVE 2 isoform X2 n=1 Tax=Lycium ferocissimum TaxID=112874 RepID=UPI00281619C1|nr:protein SODIUM POTASSIUM ROOT DEFECTIVE 2 isoform X2 [Lycium ferocissimum]